MTEPATKTLPTPRVGNVFKKDLVNKILKRFLYIRESKMLLPNEEEVLGIFKTNSVTTNHI